MTESKTKAIKWKHWEFWPTWLVYLPVLICYPYWALRCWDVFFFALVNPGMDMGGLYGASKWKSLKQLRPEDKPITACFEAATPIHVIADAMDSLGLRFPVVVKPDTGERGKGVDLVLDARQLERSVESQTTAFLVQEYLDMPTEAGLFYIKMPWEELGKLTSIVVKGFLTVVGDGQHSIEQLALANKRAVLVWEKLKPALNIDVHRIPAVDEAVLLEPIGNHSRGTAFNDGNYLINPQLEAAVEALAAQHDGFYYGRFDVRAPSMEALKKGEGMKVMEINGANAEPAHIYQEGASLVRGLATLVKYWNTLHRISRFNQKNHDKVKFNRALFFYRQWKSAKQTKWNPQPKSV